jgi:hypothetical protein
MVQIETTGKWGAWHDDDLSLEAMQKVLKGKLEVIGYDDYDDRFVAYGDENGRNLGLDVNEKVHEMLWVLFKWKSPPSDDIDFKIVGSVLLCRNDENGVECGLLPSDLVEIAKYFGPCSFKKYIMVQHLLCT